MYLKDVHFLASPIYCDMIWVWSFLILSSLWEGLGNLKWYILLLFRYACVQYVIVWGSNKYPPHWDVWEQPSYQVYFRWKTSSLSRTGVFYHWWALRIPFNLSPLHLPLKIGNINMYHVHNEVKIKLKMNGSCFRVFCKG